MKKRLYVLSVVSLLLIVGCGSEPSSSTASSPSTNESSEPSITLYSVNLQSSHATAILEGTKTQFAAGDTVVVKVTEVEEKYTFDRLEIKDANDGVISYTPVADQENQFSFSMPASNVTVTAFGELTTYHVNLSASLPEGIKVEVPTEAIVPNTDVTVKVTNIVPTTKRVTAVKMNGTSLEGTSSEENVTSYIFKMPEGDAEISVETVDLYTVGVSTKCQDAFALEGNLVAAAGEVVTFTPVFFAGYWAKDLAAVQLDVELQKVTDKPGYYTFVMPEHNVTITAEIGQPGYLLFVEEKSPYFSLEYAAGYEKDVYLPGDAIQFKINKKSVDADVVGVKVNGVELPALEEGEEYYEIEMPRRNVKIEPILKFNYKTIVVEPGENAHFTYALKTTIDEKEVEVTDSNVLTNAEIKIVATENTELEKNNFVPTHFKVYAGKDAKTATEVTDITVNSDYEGTFTFKTNDNFYFKFAAVEEETAWKNDPMLGKYEGLRCENGKQEASIDYFGNAKFYSYDSTKQLVKEENKDYQYTASTGRIFTQDDGVFVYQTSAGSSLNYSNVYLYAKGKGKLLCSERSDGTYAIAVRQSVGATSKEVGVLMCAKYENEEDPICVYFDGTKVYWNVKVNFFWGKNASTLEEDDIVEILDDKGNLLQTVVASHIRDREYDGFTHKAYVAAADDYAGTYTNGDKSISLDGIHYATIDGKKYLYDYVDSETDMIKVVIGDETKYYVVDKAAKTFVDSRGPRDGFQGEYTLGDQKVVLDGYDKATIGENTYTYETVGSRFVRIHIGDEIKNYIADIENKTLTLMEGEFNDYISRTYEMLYVVMDGSYKYYYLATIEFLDGVNCKLDVSYGMSVSNRTYYNVFNSTSGSYAIAEDGSITFKFAERSNKCSFKLTPNGEGKLHLAEKVNLDSREYIPGDRDFELAE